ncbi:hypothetical protein [Spiroplasma endosymbiont of Nomada ruficornis]|uniref:hypothetical protein n=1 Tax=Spiroplasma endosymbiont of Nomada ruficornis TaxID=3066325 RepID=UPI00313B8DFC
MIFINVSPLLWDIIIFAIIIFGIVAGFFIGGRALTFISAGNLLSIGLMLAFKPMLIDSFKIWYHHGLVTLAVVLLHLRIY